MYQKNSVFLTILSGLLILNFSHAYGDIYRFTPSELVMDIHKNQNVNITKEKFDEFIRYTVSFEGEKIIVEAGAKQYGDLTYIIGNDYKIFKAPNIGLVNFYQWDVGGNKSSIASTFNSKNGYNVFIGYTISNNKLCIGRKFIHSLKRSSDME